MPPEGPPIRKKNVRPNKMVYFDAQGVRHEIHIPTGTYERATALFVAKDWDELAKFPVWANQQYTEADFYTPEEDKEEKEEKK